MLFNKKFKLFVALSLFIIDVAVSNDDPPTTTPELSFNIANECMELLRLNKDPLECCIYPKLEADPQLTKKCKRSCPSKERGRYNCCYRGCLFRRSGVYEDEKFQRKKLRTFFTFNGISSGVAEKWKEIVKVSMRKCESEITFSNKTTEDSCVPNSIHEIITCSWKENFINCPNLSDDKICQDMKQFVNECAKSDGKFIFYNFFFGMQRSGTTFA